MKGTGIALKGDAQNGGIALNGDAQNGRQER